MHLHKTCCCKAPRSAVATTYTSHTVQKSTVGLCLWVQCDVLRDRADSRHLVEIRSPCARLKPEIPMVFRTTTALEGLLVLFDPSVQYVAVINKSDGRIRVFNAITCALHVDITKKRGSKGRAFTSDLCSACWSVQVRASAPLRCGVHHALCRTRSVEHDSRGTVAEDPSSDIVLRLFVDHGMLCCTHAPADSS